MTLSIPAPMLASAGGKPFTSQDWVYEVKYDGYRCLARAGGGQPVELRTKSGVDCTKWFPEVAQLLADMPGGPHVIDGEGCVLDEIGRSDFERLQARARRRRWYAGCDPVTLCAFDLLYANGRSLMHLPLASRKLILQELVEPLAPRLVVVGHFPAEALLFEQAVMGARLEGFVAKRLAAPYMPGVRSRDWLKIKRDGWQEGRTCPVTMRRLGCSALLPFPPHSTRPTVHPQRSSTCGRIVAHWRQCRRVEPKAYPVPGADN